MVSSQNVIDIYTDGACRGNPGPGGYAAVFCDETGQIVNEFTGHEAQTTNNRMELKGAILALENAPVGQSIRLHTDSTYVRDGITLWIHTWRRNQWMTSQKKPVKNQDLWQILDALCQNHTVEWFWVKAHQGHKMNEHADLLARQAILTCLMSVPS